MQSADEWLEIGKIVGVQGLKGQVRVYPNTDFPERFEQPGPRWLLHPGATQPEPITLKAGRYLEGKGLYLVQFAGISDRNQAEALRDSRILVPKSDRPPLEEGEFHVADLLGLEVYDQATQQLIGSVTEVFSAGNDLLEVELSVPNPPQSNLSQPDQPQLDQPQSNQPQAGKSRKVLIPFVEAIVPLVDLKHRRIEITPPPGLIEP